MNLKITIKVSVCEENAGYSKTKDAELEIVVPKERVEAMKGNFASLTIDSLLPAAIEKFNDSKKAKDEE